MRRDVINLIPKESIFAREVISESDRKGEICIAYPWSTGRFRRAISFLRLAIILFNNKDASFHFHWVPYKWLLVYLIFLKRDVVLYFWGGEYYESLLPIPILDEHCVRKSNYLDGIEEPTKRLKRNAKQKIRAYAVCWVARRSSGIVCSKKLYRYISFYSWMTSHELFYARFLGVPKYGLLGLGPLPLRSRDEFINGEICINVLVCHNASDSLNVEHTAEVLKRISTDVGIAVHGFLSYSGGSDCDRDQVEKKYSDLFAPYSKSVTFYRQFMPMEELDNVLDDLDLAVFSAYRDEGVSLLRRFVLRGGAVCFNRFSINYSYFKDDFGSSLLSVDQLLNMSNQEIFCFIKNCRARAS